MKTGRVIESVVEALTNSLGGDILTFHLCAVVADKPTVSCLGLLYASPTDGGFEGVTRFEFRSLSSRSSA